jgi:predicted alpha-1,2-mannosidase
MMIKKNFIGLLAGALLLIACDSHMSENKSEVRMPVDYVNPYIGNISHLLVPTYPTVHLPNSILRVYPERRDFTSDEVLGLPVIVTSHRGSSAFNISPVHDLSGTVESVKLYSYDNEKITPYRYQVYLDDEQVEVDFAPSHQAAVYSLVFGKEGNGNIIVNTRDGGVQYDGNGIAGYQIIHGGPTRVYVYMETKQKPEQVGILDGKTVDFTKTSAEGRNRAVVLSFKEKEINLRYGISFIGTEQARKNLEREVKTYHVQEVADKGREIWNHTLGKIEIQEGLESDKTVFYTSLYRTYERMINLSEDGRYYSGIDNKVHEDGGVPFYTDDWVWDTYRATHPLRILIEEDMERDMITSYIRMAQQSKEGWAPTFPEVTGDSHRMNGNHAVAVVWDAYCKGMRGFDLEAAYTACKGALTEKSLLPWVRVPNTELDVFYVEKGYFPALQPDEAEYVKEVHHFEKRQAVAVTLGTCYDDWCLSQIARALGKTDDYMYFLKRSYNYRNLYNRETAFFHPKDKDGRFIEPFDYRYSGGKGAREYYDENNGWIYRWDVPHNPADLIQLMGSAENFVNHLNRTFRESLGKGKSEFYFMLPDHTGNVGQFSMANEPCMHIPYLYNYAGQPWMTQKRIRTLLAQWFRNDLMGMPGDEDGGGTTAFVVFSSMGFYPVTPGIPVYNIGSPLFRNVKMKLSNGKIFEIDCRNFSVSNKYIRSATLNGKEWNKPWFHHDDIAEGGQLVLVMGDKPNYSWGSSPADAPPSAEAMYK